LGWDLDPQVAFIFNILVQTASLLAVIIYFKDDLLRMVRQFFLGIRHRKPFENTDSRLAWLIILATIPAGLFGFLFKDQVELAFNSTLFIGVALFINSIILTSVEWVGKRNRNLDEMNVLDSLIIGFSQIIAIFPGISRSGSTISGGMFRNFNRTSAAKFSFLMSIPVLAAAGLLATSDLLKLAEFNSQALIYLPGLISSAVVSYLSIRFLIQFLMKHSLYYFAIYCAIVGIVIIAVYWIQ
jgi:undecaprenyl-diphosphatase